MKKSEMRLQFKDDELKSKLEELASDCQISLNAFVNMICAAYFSDREKNQLNLMVEISQISKINI